MPYFGANHDEDDSGAAPVYNRRYRATISGNGRRHVAGLRRRCRKGGGVRAAASRGPGALVAGPQEEWNRPGAGRAGSWSWGPSR